MPGASKVYPCRMKQAVKATALVLSVSLFSVSLALPAFAAAKPIKSNFSNMKDLLASMKAKGIVCETYKKTPAELVIEEGDCSIMGENVLIDLWPLKNNYAKDFADAALGIPKVSGGGKIYVFYSNNFQLTINEFTYAKPNNKVLQVANLLQKKLGLKYRVGKG